MKRIFVVNKKMHPTHIQYVGSGRRAPPEPSTPAYNAGILALMMRTIFCVQPYRRSGEMLRKGHMRRLLSRDAAINAARAMKAHEDGVIVFRVTGCPEADFWSDPVMIARAGDTPQLDA